MQLLLGKPTRPSLGWASHTYNLVFGPTRNYFDSTHGAGGSSGCAAVGLTAGMINLADGSDMICSLPNPVGFNGVYGLRPTWGFVPSDPMGDTFHNQLATVDSMGRSPGDVAPLLDVQAGPDPRQSLGLRHVPTAGTLDADLRGLEVRAAHCRRKTACWHIVRQSFSDLQI